MLQALDDAAVGQWYRAAVEALSEARGRLDDLNVFPVPDGDTGTNLLLTAQAAVAALDREGAAHDRSRPGRSSPAARCSAPAATPAPSSPSCCAAWPTSSAGQPAGRRPGPRRGARARPPTPPTRAVADPEEGTFLTVARGGADAARGRRRRGPHRRWPTSSARPPTAPAPRSRAPPTSSRCCATPGWSTPAAPGSAWSSTPWSPTVTGVEPARPPLAPPARRRRTATPRERRCRTSRPPGPGSEVQYLLADADEESVARLHDRLAALGDSLVVVGVDTPTGREWNVHVHVADVGAAIEAGIEAGRPYRISVSPLAPVPPPAPVPGRAGGHRRRRRATGLAELFAGEGVRVVTCGPDGVTEDDVLAEILASAARGERRPAQRRRR